MVNMILNRTGAPASNWPLCLADVCFLMNHLAVRSLDWRTPTQMLTGKTNLTLVQFYNFIFGKKLLILGLIQHIHLNQTNKTLVISWVLLTVLVTL
jgi:hypothetical protein